MKIKIRADSVEIEGYVNAVERLSKPLMSRVGKFIERICAGAFRKALKRADDVHILLNHDWTRDLGSIKRGNLELEEDNIGLHARATITDPEVVEAARSGDLVGWSFGFKDRDVENAMEDGLPLRRVRDLDLYEVSILNRKMRPAYAGTLISTRAIDGKEEMHFRGEDFIDDDVEIEKSEEIEEKRAEGEENNEKPAENEPNVEETANEGEEKPVEKPVEKSANVNYNIYRDMINELKKEV